MLKRLTLYILVCLTIFEAIAQPQNTDSLWSLATTTKNDSLKFELLTQNIRSKSKSLEESFALAKKEVEFGEKHNDLAFKASGYLIYASLYGSIGEYAKAQEAIVKASTIVEDMPESGNYLAAIYNSKGTSERDINKRIEYLKKGIAICKDEFYKRVLNYNLAYGFLQLNQVDSALYYAQKNNEIGIKYNDTLTVYLPTLFGRIYLKLNQTEIAYAYFKKAYRIAQKSNGIRNYTVAYNGFISYFTSLENLDSVLAYKKKFFVFESPDAYPSKVEASKFIYEYYSKKGIKDSVIKYLQYNVQGNDSLNSLKKIEELNQAKINEELRQKDLEQDQLKTKESRNHNIQLAITAIAILSAIILFLLLSRSILVSHKVVEFLSVLVLLVVFEFINLLIHPFLESITHHSPVLMLLGLVAIAALIIPLHHRLEYWTTQKLVEKNKAIRLANAKKTIEELESSGKITDS